MKKPKFIRRNWNKYKRLGLRNKKKLVWRRPRGKQAKMRKRRTGYPVRVDSGYRSEKASRGLIQGMRPVLVRTVKEIAQLSKGDAAVLAHVGKKRRKELLAKAEELKIKVLNGERK